MIRIQISNGQIFEFESCIFSGKFLHDGGGVSGIDACDDVGVLSKLILLYMSVRERICGNEEISPDTFDERFEGALSFMKTIKEWKGGEMSEKTTH